jgi:hypothetical protein
MSRCSIYGDKDRLIPRCKSWPNLNVDLDQSGKSRGKSCELYRDGKASTLQTPAVIRLACGLVREGAGRFPYGSNTCALDTQRQPFNPLKLRSVIHLVLN